MAQKVAGRAGTRTGGAEDDADLARRLREGYGGPPGEWARFRALIRRLHRLGPRPTGELVAQIIATVPGASGTVLELLNRYAGNGSSLCLLSRYRLRSGT
jgi:hypothetical protein